MIYLILILSFVSGLAARQFIPLNHCLSLLFRKPVSPPPSDRKRLAGAILQAQLLKHLDNYAEMNEVEIRNAALAFRKTLLGGE